VPDADESSALTAHARRHHHVDQAGVRYDQAVPPRRRQPGQRTLRPGVQQRGHLPLPGRGRTGHSQVDPRHQLLPRSASPEAVFEHLAGEATLTSLPARYDLLLGEEKPPKPVLINS
jgi:hypothetical protein